MDIADEGDRLVVRLDPGDHVMESLKRLREEHAIENAFFTGIGAVDHVVLGHYDVEEEDYKEKSFDRQFEVMNFTGNIGPDKLHAHITLGRRDFSVIGGHCAAATVSGTFELIVVRGDTPLTHTLDERTGLDVFDL